MVLLGILQTQLDMCRITGNTLFVMWSQSNTVTSIRFDVCIRTEYNFVRSDRPIYRLSRYHSRTTLEMMGRLGLGDVRAEYTAEQVADIMSRSYQENANLAWTLSMYCIFQRENVEAPRLSSFKDVNTNVIVTVQTHDTSDELTIYMHLNSLDGQHATDIHEDDDTYIPIDISLMFDTKFPLNILRVVLPQLGLERYIENVPEFNVSAVD